MELEELGLEPMRVAPLLYNYLIKQQILNFRPNLPVEILAPGVYSFYIPKSLLENEIFIGNCHFIGIFFGIDNEGYLAVILKNVKISDETEGLPTFEGLGNFYLGSPSNNFNWTPISQADATAFATGFRNTFYPNANRDYQTNKSIFHSNTYVRCGYYIGDECLSKVLKKGSSFWNGLQVHIGINTLYNDEAVYNLQLLVNGVGAPDTDAYKKISQGPSFKKMWVTEPASPAFELEGRIIMPPVIPVPDLGEYRRQSRQRIAVEMDPNNPLPPPPPGSEPMGATCTLPCPPHGNCLETT